MTVTVAMASTGLSPATVGKDQQIPMPLRLPDGTPPYDRTYTTTSSDPGRLLISTDPEAVGSATATSSTPNNFYLQALSDNGRATITATATGLIGSTAVITLTGSAVTMQPYASGNPAPAAWDGKIWNATTQSGATSINLLVTSANPSGNGITQTGQSASIRPGAPDPIVTFQSSNPAAGVIKETSARLNRATPTPAITFQPVGPGQTDLRVISAAGFVTVANDKTTFSVTLPAFANNQPVTLSRDTIQQTSVSLLSTVKPPAANLAVTIASPDPSRLLLSADPDTDPTPSITRVLIGGQQGVGPIYLHALSGAGTITVKVSAPGFGDSTIPVTLAPLTASFRDVFSTPVRLTLQDGVRSGMVSISGQLRPGESAVRIGLRSSDPSVASLDDAEVVINPGGSSGSFVYRAVSAGGAVLSMILPEGISVTPPGLATLAITVAPANLSFSSSYLSLAKDSQVFTNLSGEGGFSAPVDVTIKSSDPTKLLVADSATSPGGWGNYCHLQGSILIVLVQCLERERTGNSYGFGPRLLPPRR